MSSVSETTSISSEHNSVGVYESCLPCAPLRDASAWTILDWLAARQDAGLFRQPALRCRTSRVSTLQLASKMAWNPSRIRNMIIAVGPGTPASVLWRTAADRDEESDMDFEEDDDDDHDESMSTAEEGTEEQGGTEGEGEEGAVVAMQLQSAHPPQPNSDGDHSQTGDSDGDDDSNEGDDIMGDEVMRISDQPLFEATGPHAAERLVREFIVRQVHRSHIHDSDEDDDESSDGHNPRQHPNGWNRSSQNYPSMRHGGCINTASWMDCPWQLASNHPESMSSSSSSSIPVSSRECPTQLITSGDDRLVKLWDVRHAMGMASPLEGGWDTFLPLANSAKPDTAAVHKSWKPYYRKRASSPMAGGVIHLATLVTGHRGNVFHATPVHEQPGKILTCGADGCLRLSDLQSETSAIVTYLGDRNHFVFQSTMAFSHVFQTAHTGLVCSEEGLHRFDLRLAPREQERRSLTQGVGHGVASDYCKSCAVWTPHVQRSERSGSTQAGVESSYVFVGGRSELVALLDLRVGGGSRIVESYRPRCLYDTRNVSVSGIDVSKTGSELLVSYESDQIYTFPILNNCFSKAGPTLEEIDAHVQNPSSESVRELAAYGGHLNRFTFLKNAKYAGPRDDYICTGSDSGFGWIYDRKTGAAVALLGADKCTSNGVIPHPSLPFFISYGIDSTAKLWRASTPVSLSADDSPSGRAQCALEQEYEMSPVARSWGTVRKIVESEAKPGMMPDFVASPGELASGYRFASRERSAICGAASTIYGNGLRVLPSVLRRNRHECYRAFQRSTESSPVEQPPEEFSHRVSISRLRLQAERLGLKWDPTVPWAFEVSEDSPKVHPADLVPDNPSDWVLLDGNLTGTIYQQRNFNEHFLDILSETFADDPAFFEYLEENFPVPWLKDYDLPEETEVMANDWSSADEVEDKDFVMDARRMFFATIELLKNGGNEAMKDGQHFAAARRYDKCIQYCAVALMRHHQGFDLLKHLSCRSPLSADFKESSPLWTPLVQLLVTTRLNMALLMLRPEIADPGRSVEQARAALEYLYPFTNHGIADPSIYALQAKAHFRLGSAKLELGSFEEAVEYFEESLQDSKASSSGKPDTLLLRRLQEAKRKLKSKTEREKKRYQRAFRRVKTTTNGTSK